MTEDAHAPPGALEPDLAPHAPPFPWPPPREAGLVDSADALARTWTASVFRPAVFFRALPAGRGTRAALVYYIIIGSAAAGIALFWNVVLALALDEPPPPLLRALGYTADTTEALTGFLLSPPVLLLALLLSAAIGHVFLALAGAARAGFGTTARTLAYAAGPQLFAVVPLLGDVVALAWSFAISVIGLREAHATETWRVLVALVVLPVVTLALLAVLVLGLAMLVGTGLGLG